MTAPACPSAAVGEPDALTLTRYGPDTGPAQFEVVRELYAEIYAEPPYLVGPPEVRDFAAGLRRRVTEPDFRLVVARWAKEAVGFAFGVQLEPRTRWWDGALTPLSTEFTTERPGRTFAILEIGVRRPYRGQGVARRMHAELVAGLTEERVTLLVLPDAPAPRQAYHSWGYRPVGRIRLGPGGPVYDAMVKPLFEEQR